MTVPRSPHAVDGEELAAVLAAGIGVFAVGLINPVGMWILSMGIVPQPVVRPLLSLVALLAWALSWMWLMLRWRGKRLSARWIVVVAGGLILLGLGLGSPLICYLWHGLLP